MEVMTRVVDKTPLEWDCVLDMYVIALSLKVC